MTWLLDDLIRRIPEIEKVVLLSRDGLAASSSSSVSREDAERLAAIAAGFHSLARGSVASLGGGQTHNIIVEMTGKIIVEMTGKIIVEMTGKFLLVAAAGPDGCIAAVADAKSRLGIIVYEITLLARRAVVHLPGPRRAVLGGGMT